jgi:hypothetical protein
LSDLEAVSAAARGDSGYEPSQCRQNATHGLFSYYYGAYQPKLEAGVHPKLRILYSLCPQFEELLNGGRTDRTTELLGPGALEHCVPGSSLLHPANQFSVITDA